MAKLVQIKRESGIGYVKLNRPDKLNALSRELVQEVMQALDDLSADNEVKAIILSGEGKAFSAGGDISSMKELTNASELAEWIEYISSLSQKIINIDKYVIAAVHGYAAGAGFSIALAADFVVADEQAKFALSFSNIGLIPDLGLIKMLSAHVSPSIAKKWISSAETLSAKEAHSYGLVNEISFGSVVEAAAEFADFIVKGPPISNKYVKYLVNHVGEVHKETAFMQENMIQAMLLQTQDHQEGVSAFFDKRNPQFKGK